MKKLLYLPLLLLFVKVQAQQNVVFKIKYLPNHTYAGAISMGMVVHADLSGDTAVLAKLKSQGLTPPLAMNMDMKMDGTTKTGATGANQAFPITMGFKFDNLSMDLNGNSIPIPTEKLGNGVSVYGHIGADGTIKADSIGGAKAGDTSQEKVAKLMNTIQKHIQFPDHPMKIGETFTQTMPMSIPMGGSNMDLNSQVVYKLVSITDGNANFDVQQSMDMSMPIAGATINISGTGGGKLVYSIKDNFATDYSTNVNLKVTGQVKTLKIDATAQMNMEYKYTIN
ncbi:MAG TPA: hypothetical protein VFE53_15100 [Mucilaginibacter sp.]|jgi:hypothetical protein|nr:hypothetical protein [Mucilaginibacter sp.]